MVHFHHFVLIISKSVKLLEKVWWCEICNMFSSSFVLNIFYFDKYVVSFALDAKTDRLTTLCEVPGIV